MIEINREGHVTLKGEPAEILRALISCMRDLKRGRNPQDNIVGWEKALAQSIETHLDTCAIEDRCSLKDARYNWRGRTVTYPTL